MLEIPNLKYATASFLALVVTQAQHAVQTFMADKAMNHDSYPW